ncbi:MAG: cadherin repeat domain-containing protein, partial [Alphaproteobacteria bacterium]
MDAPFVRRSAVLGRTLPALALFWPTVPGAEVRATWPLDNGAHDDTDPAGPVPQTREQAPSVPLPGVRLAAQADGSDTFAAPLILPEGRRLDPATADLRLEAGQGLSGTDALAGGSADLAQASAPPPQPPSPAEAADFTRTGTDLASKGGSNVTIIEDKSSLGAIVGAGASLVGMLVVASAYADLSKELVQLSQTIAEHSASAAATVDDDDGDQNEDEDEDGEDAASGDGGTEAENKAPTFIELTGTGSVSETAAAGTLTGVAVTATDPEGAAVTYAIAAQDVAGAFAVHPENGSISVADPGLIDFESHETLSLTISATDPEGASATQSLSIRIEDDASDAINPTPAYTQAHDSLLSGALVFGSLSADPAFPDARFGFGGIETLSGDATVDLFLTAQEYFLSGPGSVETALSAPGFSILPEINLIELDKGTVMLGSFDASGAYLMTFSVSETDFSGEDGFEFGLYAKSYQANASGVAEESYQFSDGSITRFTEPVFFDNHPALTIDPGAIIHFADLTGDGRAELLVRPAGATVVQAYENLGDGFAEAGRDGARLLRLEQHLARAVVHLRADLGHRARRQHAVARGRQLRHRAEVELLQVQQPAPDEHPRRLARPAQQDRVVRQGNHRAHVALLALPAEPVL